MPRSGPVEPLDGNDDPVVEAGVEGAAELMYVGYGGTTFHTAVPIVTLPERGRPRRTEAGKTT